MLLNLSKKTWTEGLLLHNFTNHAASNEKVRRDWLAAADLSSSAVTSSTQACLGS
jgi:hypothetical protein